MYYFFMALVDIFFYLVENWQQLTATAVASTVGIILGKRIGSQIAVKQFMKMLGLEKKSKLERKVDWLIKQEEARGNRWDGNIGTSSNMVQLSLKKLSSLSRAATGLKNKLRRIPMKDFLTGKKKWLAFLLAVILNGLNDVLGLGMEPETINTITNGATGYIVVEGVLDLARSFLNHFKAKGEAKNAELDVPIESRL